MNFWADVLPPVAGALLIWWASTGIIIYVCGRAAWRPWVFGVVTALQPLAWWRLWAEKSSSEVGGVFASFFWAVVIWAWIETSYYSGMIVGRRLPELEPDAPTGLRLRRAIAANLYHELSILALSVVVVALGWGGQNETGLWAFMILHWTHQSAKINIFLGVSNLTTEYLPDNLRYMAQYFSQKPLNMFFPFSATITTVLATFLFASTASATSAGQQVGQALLFVMMCAAVLEHWWLVTPVPSRAWAWALKSRKEASVESIETLSASPATASSLTLAPVTKTTEISAGQPAALTLAPSTPAARLAAPDVYVICGYLGSGKTTLIRHLLPQLDGRVAVVVNDFGAVGVDAELLRTDGSAGAVLELPGGCVCCTLQKNLSGQLLSLLDEYKPERVLIEPSGVAGIEEIVRVLAHPRLAGRLGKVEVVTVVDAPRLLNANGLPKFTLTQIKAAQAIVVSKTDLVPVNQSTSVLGLVASLNPQARLFGAVEGAVSAAQLLNLPQPQPDFGPQEAGDDDHDRSNHHDEEAGLISFAREYDGIFDPAELRRLFDDLAAGYFGPVERVKGLFPVPGGGRQAWDIADGTVFCRLLPQSAEKPSSARFMLVANDLATEELHKRLQLCILEGALQRNRAGA